MKLLHFLTVSLGAVTAIGAAVRFRCSNPPIHSCPCNFSSWDYSMYYCSSTNRSSTVNVSVNAAAIIIDCTQGTDQYWTYLMDGVNATDSFAESTPTEGFGQLYIDCPVPENKSVAEILENLSVKKIEGLNFTDSKGFKNEFTDRYLKNLTFVSNLNIEGDIKSFPKKVLDGMPNLTSIELPKHVMSALLSEVLRLEAEKRSSNSTHNNTVTDNTLIEQLSKLSELNVTNTNIQILVGKTSDLLPNLERVNLTNNNITFLLFENLPNLTNVFLTNNRICNNSREGTFNNLTNLERITMNNNEIKSLESGTFKDLRSLQNLSLRGNNLKYLPGDLFKNCTNLMILDISKNNLTALNETLFHGLKALKNLSLQDNHLTKITR